jgi:hypothetical protein
MQPDPGPHLGPLGFPAGLVDRSETLERDSVGTAR